MADDCNYKSYLEKFLTYPPPPAPFPLPGTSVEADPGCDVWSLILEAALVLNPAFDIVRVFDMVTNICCPSISTSNNAHHTIASYSLGRPGQPVSHRMVTSQSGGSRAELVRSGTFPQIQVKPVYFNRPDVKAAIHAPQNVQWTECTSSVFVPPGDTSPPSAWEVLPRVIARGARTVIVTGLADFVLISEG